MEQHVKELAKKAVDANTSQEALHFADAAEKVAHAYSCLVHTNDEAKSRQRKWAEEDAWAEQRKTEEAAKAAAAETARVEPDSASEQPTKPAAKPAKT